MIEIMLVRAGRGLYDDGIKCVDRDMALYSLHQSILTRSSGSSAIAHSAYNSASHQEDERTGQAWNYTAKREVVASWIAAPEGSPSWCLQREELWNRVELFEDEIADKRFRGHTDPEKKKRSLEAKEKYLSSTQVAQKIMVALPLELSLEQSRQAMDAFVRERFVSRGLVVQCDIHEDAGNPHAHLMITRRAVIDGAFSPTKDREILSRDELKVTRKQWEIFLNKALERAGVSERVTCESYESRGLEIVPTRHLGWQGASLQKQGLPSRIAEENRSAFQENVDLFLRKPQEILKAVSQQKVVFTKLDVERELFRRVEGDERLFGVIKGLLEGVEPELLGKAANTNDVLEGRHAQPELISRYAGRLLSGEGIVSLGSDVRSNALYVTKADQEREAQIRETLARLSARAAHGITSKRLQKVIGQVEKKEEIAYSEEQKEAIESLVSERSLTLLTGNAGTGKSTTLKVVAEAYKREGYRVLGTAFQGVVAEALSVDLGIEAHSLEMFKRSWDHFDKAKAVLRARSLSQKILHGKALQEAKRRIKALEGRNLTSKDVVILDEGNMVSAEHYSALLKRVETSGAKLIIVYDPRQIKALYGTDVSRMLETMEGATLTSVKRQRLPWMKEASMHLNRHDVERGLQAYQDQDRIHYRASVHSAKYAMIEAFFKAYDENPKTAPTLLCFRNADVFDLNQGIQKTLIARGDLKDGIKIVNTLYHAGDKVVFTKTDLTGKEVKTLEEGSSPRIGVKNGTAGVIEKIIPEKKTLHVRLGNERLVAFNAGDYQGLMLGYAMTINKAEGKTFENALGLFDPLQDPNSLLIMATRHRENFDLYCSKEQVSSLKDILRSLGNGDFRASVEDYRLSPDARDAFEKVRSYIDTSLEASTLIDLQSEREEGSSGWMQGWEQYKALEEKRNGLALEILKDWERCSAFVFQARLRKTTLEVQAGVRDRLLNPWEEKALETVDAYRSKAGEVRTLWEKISETHPGLFARHHALYGNYEALRGERNALAYEIVTHKELHRPFFKVKEIREGESVSYESVSGQRYDARPQGLKTAIAHSDQYIAGRLEETYSRNLTPEQREAYQALKEYKQHLYEAAATFRRLRQAEEMAVTPEVQEKRAETLKEVSRARDFAAYRIVSTLEAHVPFFETLKIDESKLLLHAAAGESRTLVDAYLKAEMISQKDEASQALRNTLYPGAGGVHGLTYALAREAGVDPDQVRFTAASLQHAKEKGVLKTVSLDQIERSYATLSRYRAFHRETAKEWSLIQTKVMEQVTSLQTQQLEALQKAGYASGIERQALVQEAFARLGYTNQNARETYRSQAMVGSRIAGLSVSYLRETQERGLSREERTLFQKKTDDLKSWNSLLQKGQEGALQLYRRIEGESALPDLIKLRRSLAYDLLTREGIEVGFRGERERVGIFKEAETHEHLMKEAQKTRTFKTSQALAQAFTEAEHGLLKAATPEQGASSEERMRAVLKGATPPLLGALRSIAPALAGEIVLQKELRGLEEKEKSPFSVLKGKGSFERQKSALTHHGIKDEGREGHSLSKAKGYRRSSVIAHLDEATTYRIFADRITSHLPESLTHPEETRSGNFVRWGEKGGFAVNLKDKYFMNFYTHEKGDIFKFISQTDGIGYKEAINYVAEMISAPKASLAQETASHRAETSVLEARSRAQAAFYKDADFSRQQTEWMIKASVPIQGTLAERYLREHRKIEGELPKDLYFFKGKVHVGSRRDDACLMSVARGEDGKILSHQLTFLNPHTGAKSETHTIKKLTQGKGVSSKSFVEVQKGKGVTFIAEGLETALSIKEAGVKGEIRAGFGRFVFANARPQNNHIVLVADYDGIGAQTHDALLKDKALLESKGYKVDLLWPTQTGDRKTDFNDILRHHGKDDIQRLIQEQIPEVSFHDERPSTHTSQSHAYGATAPETQETLPSQEASQKPELKDAFFKKNALAYFERELARPYTKSMMNEALKAELDRRISTDPISAAHWWHEEWGGKSFDPAVSMEDQIKTENPAASDTTKRMISPEDYSATALKVKIENLDRKINIIEAYRDLIETDDKQLQTLKNQRNDLFGSVSDQVLSHLKEKNPEMAQRVEEHRAQQQQQIQQRQRNQGITL